MIDNADYERVILDALRAHGDPMKAWQVFRATGLHRVIVNGNLDCMEEDGLVRFNELGYWELAPNGSNEDQNG